MNIILIGKRRYTNRDLIQDRFGRFYHFPKVWSEMGHSVTQLVTDYFSFDNNVQFIDSMKFHSLGFPSLGIDYLYRVWSILRKSDVDVIIASGDSHFGYLGLRLARKLSVPFVFDLYHHYADFGTNRIPGMKSMYFKALREADLVAVDSEPLRDKVSGWSKSILVATQGADPELFKPMDRQKCRNELGLDHDCEYVGYTGSLDSRFDYDGLFGTLVRIRKDGRDVRLLIAGENTCGYKLDNNYMNYLGNVPHNLVPTIINACNVMCIPYKATELASTCNPCKLTEYIFCGLPVVASDVSNVKDYLPLSGDLCYTPGNVAGLADALVRQLDSPVREVPNNELTWDFIGKRYLEALESLTS